MPPIENMTHDNGEKILVIDDSQQILCVVSEILCMHGFNVVTAESGKAALEQIYGVKPDIIICDVMMPELDGFQVFTEVQRNPEYSQIPFLFLTALSGKSDISAAKEMGCDDYIIKPFDPDELLSAVRGKLLNANRRKASFETQMRTYRKRVIQTLSHEFRTPLVAISTGTELLIEQFENMNQANIRKLLTAIRRGGTRLQELVENFIILQQVESGKAEDSFRKFRNKQELSSLTATAIEETKLLFPNTQINFTPSNSSYGYTVDVFETHFKGSFRRIMDNAIKFSKKDSPVDISISSNAQSVWVSIRDYGPGMPENLMEVAKQMFVQINREKTEQQGCGLGLSIASAYVNINKGELLFQRPKLGTGLEVIIRFPRAIAINFI